MSPIQVTDSTFDKEVLQSNLPVLVDFWAPWCGPCRMLAPELEKIAGELGGSVVVAKMNVDQYKAAAAKYQVRGIPTLLLFKQGEVVASSVGAKPASELKRWVESHL
ncbi:thioredoxin [Paenibacillus sp. 1001270B_150601_E10]|uniref:thioredoxin n=1 Tax=Paenibacillus sp. 1001270B_150601_E10 TaxID=2787079 RepID=UPI0018A096EF|nr:thioredoxin [Paenibacillus sp. 1001270B_150601_E10]